MTRRALLPLAGLLLLAPLAASCSCQARLQRLISQCPECFLQDTILHPDTLVPPPVPILGHLSWAQLQQPQPVTLQGRNYTLDITLDDGGLTIDGNATPDTLVRTIRLPVSVPVIVREKKPAPLTPSIWWGVIACTALALLLALARTIKKK